MTCGAVAALSAELAPRPQTGAQKNVTRQLHLGGFQIASQVTHSHAAWRHPGSDNAFTTPQYYHRIGRILERGKFDFLFFADLLAALRGSATTSPSRCAAAPRPRRCWTRRSSRPASAR
jgi:hypothetical protein